jgi:hypothetical protein
MSLHRSVLAKVTSGGTKLQGDRAKLLFGLRDGSETLVNNVIHTLGQSTAVDAQQEVARVLRISVAHMMLTTNLVWCMPPVWQKLVERVHALRTARVKVSKNHVKSKENKGAAKARAFVSEFSLHAVSHSGEGMDVPHLTYALIVKCWLAESTFPEEGKS